MLRHANWKVRREGYERLLFFLQSGSREGCIGGELVTPEKVPPFINLLGSEQNSFVALQGIECLKVVMQQPSFRMSSINHFLSEGLEKYASAGKLTVEFEAVINGLAQRWCSAVVALVVSKLENKNATVQLFCLQLLSSTAMVERITRSKDGCAQLSSTIARLCASQNRQVKTLATELSGRLGIRQHGTSQPRKHSLESLYSDLARTYDQLSSDKRIELAQHLRKEIERMLRTDQLSVDADHDHFGLQYMLRMMIEDSNQLLWAEGVRVLALLIPQGIFPKEINYLVEKLRCGKSPSNQLLYQLFDEYLLQLTSRKTDEYLATLRDLFESSNKENVRTGVLQLVARLAYFVNSLDGNGEACDSIQNEIFFGFPLFAKGERIDQEQAKRRLVNSYNKVGLGWLLGQRASRYKELVEVVLLSMKHYNDKSFLQEKENRPQKPAETVSKKQGLSKALSEVLAAAGSKQLDRKVALAEDFLRSNRNRYPPFFLLEHISWFVGRLRHTNLSLASANRLSVFVLDQLMVETRADLDNDSRCVLVDVCFRQLSFGRCEHHLTQLLGKMVDAGVFPCLLEHIKGRLLPLKKSTLKATAAYLAAMRDRLHRNHWYGQVMHELEAYIVRQPIQSNYKLAVDASASKRYLGREEQSFEHRTQSKHEEAEQVRRQRHQASQPKQVDSDDPLSFEWPAKHAVDSVEDASKSPASEDFEELVVGDKHLLPTDELRERLTQNRNCFFFLKNEVYARLLGEPQEHSKIALLRELAEVVAAIELSDVAYDNLLNMLFLLFLEVTIRVLQGRRQEQLAEELQQFYEQLRRRRSIEDFFVGLLRNIKPILESISEAASTSASQVDSEFVASIIARSLSRLGPHISRGQRLSMLCHINEYFQLGEVVYFELYSRQYELINHALFDICGEWLKVMASEEAAATMDTFDALCDNAFKRFVEAHLQ